MKNILIWRDFVTFALTRQNAQIEIFWLIDAKIYRLFVQKVVNFSTIKVKPTNLESLSYSLIINFQLISTYRFKLFLKVQKHEEEFSKPNRKKGKIKKSETENSFWRTKNHLNRIMTIKYFQIYVFDTPRHAYFSCSRAKKMLADKLERRFKASSLSQPQPNFFFGLRATSNYLRIPNVRILISNQKKNLKCFMNW